MKRPLAMIWTLLFLFSATLLLVACDGKAVAEQATQEAVVASTSQALSESGLVEGEVVPVKTATLTFSTNGIVVEVLAEEGDAVKKDQVIARLDGKTRLEAAIATAELQVLDAQQALDDLYENAGLRRAAAQLSLAEAETALDQAQKRVESKDLKRGTQEQIDGAWANYIVAVEQVKDLEEDFEEFKDEPEDDWGRANALAELAAARDLRDDLYDRWDELNSPPDELDVAEAEAQLQVASANLEKAQADWEELGDGIDEDELQLAQANLKNAEARLESAKIALTDIELTAPFDGVIVTSAIKVGEAVSLTSPTLPSVTLADTSVWKVETTDLTELEVVDVQVNEPATVTFDALPDLELTGKVESIEALGVNKQGDITYTVTLALDELDDHLRWKMTANVRFGD